ncbi:2,5-dichloro-2,5-cyclohexadiene-1,4-diol dehydrogenase [Chelatococcus reniformis]|uniref:2,5-dichloro-2,5-cyclohexadiene-1,4-diol dehydrogenase n=1 Tax=Chelatococcus reniformis TaxID=1494448 RepID=A0A916XBL5_9HYPH|nr:2,5-dichloro-2,5-cyclohexadiene-1,4-diol dehydrogenase [Chelatococcus reniformis]
MVTGGASGIGLAAVERLLAAGARVVVADLNEKRGAEVLRQLGSENLRFVATDVADETQVERMFGYAVDQFGRLDILFNNAGLGGAVGPITEIGYDNWRRTFDILVGGVFLGIKHAARLLIAQGDGGIIVNTASIAGTGAGFGPQAYSAAKAAVINLTETAAVELAAHRIRVNAICPGVIFTQLWIAGDEDGAADAIRNFQPWPDQGQPGDIADALLFLTSKQSAFMTGQTLTVDGGLTAAHGNFFQARASNRALSTISGFTYGTTGHPNIIKRLDTTAATGNG